WVDDPSNADPAALRARLRATLAEPDGDGPATRAAVATAAQHGEARRAAERSIAAELAASASIHPEGYATLSGAISPPALAALVRAVAGAAYPPPARQAERLAAGLRPAT